MPLISARVRIGRQALLTLISKKRLFYCCFYMKPGRGHSALASFCAPISPLILLYLHKFYHQPENSILLSQNSSLKTKSNLADCDKGLGEDHEGKCRSEGVKEREYECSTTNHKFNGIDMLSSSESSPLVFDLA